MLLKEYVNKSSNKTTIINKQHINKSNTNNNNKYTLSKHKKKWLPQIVFYFFLLPSKETKTTNESERMSMEKYKYNY